MFFSFFLDSDFWAVRKKVGGEGVGRECGGRGVGGRVKKQKSSPK